MSQQLDRTKSLWEIWVVEGLEGGRWAMLVKTHHAMVDGVSGTDLLAVIMDLSPDVARPEVAAWSPRPAPSGARLALEAVANLMRSPYEQLRAIETSTRALQAGAVAARRSSGPRGLPARGVTFNLSP